MVYDAVHTIESPGARSDPFAGVHSSNTTPGSVTVTSCNVTLPSLVAVIVYVITSPTVLYDVGSANFTIDNSGSGTLVTVSSSHASAAPPSPSSTHAVFRYDPLSRSA